MNELVFENCNYGQVALKKLAPVPDNFRLYSAGWLGEKHTDWDVMKVTGAEFRLAKSGPDKGKLAIRVKGTRRSAFVTRAEMNAFEARAVATAAGAMPTPSTKEVIAK